jgi:hypothetical protein
VIALAGCTATPSESYFAPINGIDIGGPGRPGVQSLLGIADIRARGGDTVELVSATALGASAADVSSYVLRLSETHGGIGGIQGDTFGDGLSFAAYAKPLAGFTFSAADGEIEIVLRLTSRQPGHVAFSSVDLTFRVNGGTERVQRLPTAGTICFGNPPPSSCR